MNDNQELISTNCPRIGRVCPAAEAMARTLARADRCARQAVPDFEMTGQTALDGCSLHCAALFELSGQGVALYCGVEAEAEAAGWRAPRR